jgi:putative membrane protein
MMTGWTMSLEGWIWMAAWGIVLVAIVWLLVRSPARPSSWADEPLHQLRLRLARGEITPEEFERARALIVPGAKDGPP